MPKKRQNDLINAAHYKWILRARNGVYFADGRANQPPLGRHSLGTRDRVEAMEGLRQLDLVKAVETGLADRALLSKPAGELLELNCGRELYESHARRPRVVGGVKPKTSKRYKAVFDKFLPFVAVRGITVWNQITRKLLQDYAAHLDDEGYAPRTEYLEITTVKQTMKWLADESHIPVSCLFRMPLKKPEGTDTYCWRPEEAAAIISYCRANPELNWLGDVFTALISTGLRISELASLRCSDIDRGANVIRLTDESSSRKSAGRRIRQTKSGRSRSLPIHEEFVAVLEKKSTAADGILFHGPRGGILKPDTVRNVLIRDVLTPLSTRFPTPPGEIGFINGRLHSCRHFFASRCAADGFSEQVVMAWLGHRDSKMARHYFHLHNETAQRHMGRLRLLGDAGGTVAASKLSQETPEIPNDKTRSEKP